jgi:hypothetical protein
LSFLPHFSYRNLHIQLPQFYSVATEKLEVCRRNTKPEVLFCLLVSIKHGRIDGSHWNWHISRFRRQEICCCGLTQHPSYWLCTTEYQVLVTEVLQTWSVSDLIWSDLMYAYRVDTPTLCRDPEKLCWRRWLDQQYDTYVYYLYMIFVNYTCVSTRWQWSINLYTNRKETTVYMTRNNTQNKTKTQKTQNTKAKYKTRKQT